MQTVALRARGGDDASCLNLYQARQPRLLGIPDSLIASHGGFPLTLEFKRETVMQLLTEYLEQLSDVGFKLIVVLSGHYGPPHIAALVEAANLFTS